MSKLKCPFCQQELLLSSLRDGDEEHQMWCCLSCQRICQGKTRPNNSARTKGNEMLKRLLCLLGFHKWVCKINYGIFKIDYNVYCERCGAIAKHDGWLGYIIVFKNGKTKNIKHLPVFELKELRRDNDEGI